MSGRVFFLRVSWPRVSLSLMSTDRSHSANVDEVEAPRIQWWGAGGNWPKNKEGPLPVCPQRQMPNLDLFPRSELNSGEISTCGFEDPNVDAAEAAFPLKVSGCFPTLGPDCPGVKGWPSPFESHLNPGTHACKS